jgi:hypothetical protein
MRHVPQKPVPRVALPRLGARARLWAVLLLLGAQAALVNAQITLNPPPGSLPVSTAYETYSQTFTPSAALRPTLSLVPPVHRPT